MANKNLSIIELFFTSFWIIYALIIPLLNKYNRNFFEFFKEINLPIILIWTGLLFLANYLLDKIIYNSNLFNIVFYNPEIKETNYAFLFLVVGIYFLKEHKYKVTESQKSLKQTHS